MTLAQFDTELDETDAGPWPAFTDLLAATSMLFLVLFAAIAIPALKAKVREGQRQSTLTRLDETLRARRDSTVQVAPVGDYLLIRINGDATFRQGADRLGDLTGWGRAILRDFGTRLRSSGLDTLIDQIQVVGHTSAEGEDERNWRLSATRAATVSLFLIDSAGLPACKITALGRSRYYPAHPDSNATRRVIDDADRRIELEIRPIIPGDKEQARRRKACNARPFRDDG